MRLKIFVLLVGVLLSACSSHKVTNIDGVTHKQMRLTHMKRMLNDLNNVQYARHKSEIELDDDRKRYANNLADSLKLISKKTVDFPKNDPTFIIQSSKLEEYNNLSKQLYSQGEEIENQANRYDFKALEITIENVKKTCTSCHDVVGLKRNPLKK